MQQLLDTALAQAPPGARERFAALIGGPGQATAPAPTSHATGTGDLSAVAEAEHRLVSDRNIATAVSRLDQLAGWEPGTAHREVAAQLAAADRRDLTDRGNPRTRHRQRRVAQA